MTLIVIEPLPYKVVVSARPEGKDVVIRIDPRYKEEESE